MLHTNLLPESEKLVVSYEWWQRIIHFFGFMGLCILAVGIILLAPAYLPSYVGRKELERLLVLEESARDTDSIRIKAEATALRAMVASVQEFSEHRPKATQLFDVILNRQPGIEVSGMTIDVGTVSITGHADARRNLLAFEQHLKDTGMFTAISSPLSNIIRETNITFTLQALLIKDFEL